MPADPAVSAHLQQVARQAAEAAYAAIEGIGRLSPLVDDLLAGRADPDVELEALRQFADEVSFRLAFLARTVAEQPAYELMPWQDDARVVLPVLYELGAAYLLLSDVADVSDLSRIPPVSRPTLQRLATKEVRAWLYQMLGVR